MKILLFEDNNYSSLFPLTMMRGTYDLKCGALSLKSRLELLLKEKYEVILHCRKALKGMRKECGDPGVNAVSKDDHLLLNGRIYFDEKNLKKIIKEVSKEVFFTYNSEVIAAYIPEKSSALLKEKILSDKNLIDKEFLSSIGLKEKSLANNSGLKMLSYPWDTIKILLSGALEDDINLIVSSGKRKFRKIRSDNFIDNKKIYIEKNVEILPQVAIDASAGEVLIEEGTKLEPFTYIKGPVYIGRNCLIKSGTRIYGPCSIGENSKVAGEIAESIFHSFVNKQHDGFVGHSYICPFVNLGAGTVTSDLKNNYSKIKINIEGKEIDTGMQFLGSIIGDHSKTAINTMLNTGTMIGIFTNIFGGGFASKNISSFSWNEAGKKPMRYDLKKAIETAKSVMKRRGMEMSEEYEKVMKGCSSPKPKTKRKQLKAKRSPNAAFMRPVKISDALQPIVGSKPIPRTEITKKLWNYIRKNGLQDKKNKRNINTDDNLKKIFRGKKTVNMFEMTKFVSKHLSAFRGKVKQ